MKIAMIGTFLGQKTAGAEISSYLLANHLSGIEDVFIITTKVTSEMPCRDYSMPLAKFFPHKVLMVGSRLTDFYMYRKILKILMNEMPDVVHIQDFSIMIPALKAAKKLNIPAVMTVRDFRFECNLDSCSKDGKFRFKCTKEQYKNCLKETLSATLVSKLWPLFFRHFYRRKLLLNNYAKQVDYFISVSDFVKNNLIEFGIDKNKITTIYVPKPDWKHRQDKHKDVIVLFAGGLLVKAKGFQTIIDAFHIVAKTHKDAYLIIAGIGSYETELKDMVKDIGLQEKVNFLGKISYEQMEDEYFNADIVLQSSIIPESLSRIIFEAFAAKKPVIATDSGGNNELVKDNETGFLVKINNPEQMAQKIDILIKDKNLRQKMGLEGFNLIQRLCSEETIIKNHLKIYKELAEKNGKKS